MAVQPVPASWLDEAVTAGASTGLPVSPLPSGTVTFLLTDVEDSTRQWEAAPAAMAAAIARHYALLDDAIAAHGGVRPVEQGEGDSVVAAFTLASDALAAALDAQCRLRAEAWPDGVGLAVRMAVHTGEAELRDEGNYFGPTVIRCARFRAIAAGGQVLVSGATADLVGDRLPANGSLLDRGLHRLKDLGRPERVFELRHPDVPAADTPLRSLDNLPNNLPVQLTSFVGRTEELTALRALLPTTRLLSVNGAGGCGKTRLAVQLAADVLDRYAGGTWLVELATLNDPERVPATIAAALGERELSGDLVEAIAIRVGNRPTLVVLDNCEHLLDAVATVADALLRRSESLTLVATSREPLGVPGETAWRVPSMPAPDPANLQPVETFSQFDAVRLFLDRATKARPELRAHRRQRRRRRADLPSTRGHSARGGAGGGARAQPARRDGGGRARRPLPPVDRRRPHRPPPAADAASLRRLELRPTLRARARSLPPPVGVRRRLHARSRRAGRGRQRHRAARGARPAGRARRQVDDRHRRSTVSVPHARIAAAVRGGPLVRRG